MICLRCARKANSFCQFYEFLNKAASQCPDSRDVPSKWKFSTPTGKSPGRKSLRVRSSAHAKPTSSREALFDSPTKGQPSTSAMVTNLNIDDLDATSIGFAMLWLRATGLRMKMPFLSRPWARTSGWLPQVFYFDINSWGQNFSKSPSSTIF